jgi:hypothetical protein
VPAIAKTDKEFLYETADRIRKRMSRTAQDIVEIGLDLIAVKDRVGHGKFLPWINDEFAMREDTAARFMNVARNMATQIAHGAEFQPAVLYALAAASTPEEVRTEITERATAGEKVTVADVRAAKTAVARGRQNGRCGEANLAEVSRAADRCMVTEGMMKMLDLFERDDVDPAAKAAFIVEHFDQDIVDKGGMGKLSIAHHRRRAHRFPEDRRRPLQHPSR